MTKTFGKKICKKNFDISIHFKYNSNFNIEVLDNNNIIFIQSGNDEILKSILYYLSNININYIFFIALDFTSLIDINIVESILTNSSIILLYVPNYGMDIGKFFYQLKFLHHKNIKKINTALKIHTKSDKKIREQILFTLIKSKERLQITNTILKTYNIIGCKELYWETSNKEYNKTMCEKNISNCSYIMDNYFNIKFDKEKHNSFFEGTMFWFNNNVFKDLININIKEIYKDFSYGRIADDQLIEHAWERVFCFLNHDKLFKLSINIINGHNINLSAIYFPQYHFNEENDTLWGKNFTEWTLLKPNHKKHNLDIPHDDIGFYNITNINTRNQQSKIAKEFGIKSFMIYHYWFKDKAVLNTPLELLLNDNEPNIQFFFSWANEPWTRNWDGLSSEVLIDQSFDESYDIKKHFNYLNRFFQHNNYKKINNCPVFVIYRIDIMNNNVNKFLETFNKLAKNNGFNGIHFILTVGNFNVDFNNINLKLIKATFTFFPNYLAQIDNSKYKIEEKFNYESLVNFQQPQSLHKNIPNHSSVFTSWDNTVRRLKNISTATIFVKSSPILFYEMLLTNIMTTLLKQNNESFIFINAWNEWNEQAILEPTKKHNYEYIKQIQKLYFI